VIESGIRIFRIFVISDVPVSRVGLVHVLRADRRLRVIGNADGWEEALRGMRELEPPPDVLLVDLPLPEGLGGLPALLAAFPTLPVVALAGSEDEETIIPWAEAGVSGLLSRHASLDELIRIVDGAARGQTMCTQRVTSVLMRWLARAGQRRPSDGVLAPRLTLREREIARLIDQGLSNKEIARHLQIELATVKNHVHNILRKLNASRRGEAAAILRGEGVEPDVLAVGADSPPLRRNDGAAS
jgi:two-component system, NarL family, nitrate/nitrite response regulator NarL